MSDLTMQVMEEAMGKIRALPPCIRKIRCSYADYRHLEGKLPHQDMFDPYLDPSAYIPRGFLVLEYTDDHIELVRVEEAGGIEHHPQPK